MIKRIIFLTSAVFIGFAGIAQQSFLEMESGKHKIFTNVDDALKTPSEVVVLNLRQTEINEVPQGVAQLKNLQYINIMKNKISALPAYVFAPKKLREMACRENLITEVDDAIAGLKHLVWLDLSRNKLTTIPNLSPLKKLEMLALNQNMFVQFPAGLERTKGLKTLNIDDNKLVMLPLELSKQKSIQHFSASNNSIVNCGGLFEISTLQSVNLRNNKLAALPVVWKCDGLKSLILSDNLLTEIPLAATQLANLELLDISNNPISMLPLDLSALKTLQSFIAVNTKFSPQEQARIKAQLPKNCTVLF